jgi:bacterioferritin-associated ferredoxin
VKRAFVCLCLDLTADDIECAVRDGFRDPETLKRYTACFMGPCQGKSCFDTVLELLAERTGTDAADLALPTRRAPVHPVRLGLLAGLDAAEEP